uniref:DH domain-containing protein n=1 Tax=Heterorhabditis bacteriophora TaxID=37862 RepID=A0A1I7XCV4_HETBA
MPSVKQQSSFKRQQNIRIEHSRYHAVDIDGPSYLIAHFPECDDSTQKIVVEPGMRLFEVFEEPLRSRGLNLNDVEIFIEKSASAVPENADVRFLAGRNVIVKGRCAMRVGRHTRAAHSMDDSNADRPSRKMSAEAVSRKSSFVNSRMLCKSRQQSEVRLNGSEDAVEGRGSESSLKDLSTFDEPSCSELTVDDGGTRRARSVTSSRISLFFGKEKNEMINRLNEMKENTESLSNIIPDIEEHWTDIVGDRVVRYVYFIFCHMNVLKKSLFFLFCIQLLSFQSLSRRHTEQQEAIWEIVTTEYRYIQRVFINYSQLYSVNVMFWRRAIQPMLDYSRQEKKPLDPAMLLNGFEDIAEWSKCYITFNLRHDDSHTYTQKKQKEHELFREFVLWAESQDSMRRQKLCDTLTCPMQRLTRYSLLLKMGEIMKSIDSYDCIDNEEFEKVKKEWS